MRVTGTWTAGNGMLLAYSDPFYPYGPLTGCLAGNDDYMGAGQSQIDSLPMPAGSARWVVVTTSVSGATLTPAAVAAAARNRARRT